MVKLGNRNIGDGEPCFITFEAGPTHNGLESAMRLATLAAESGADAVKFQTFIPHALASTAARKADYQQRNDPTRESQLAMLGRLSLSFDDHLQLMQRCRERDIDFLSSPFDPDSATFLLEELALGAAAQGQAMDWNALRDLFVESYVESANFSDDLARRPLGVARLFVHRLVLGLRHQARLGRADQRAAAVAAGGQRRAADPVHRHGDIG